MKRIEILDVLPGETEEQAEARRQPAPEMDAGKYEDTLLLTIRRLMHPEWPNVDPEAEFAQLERLLDWSTARALAGFKRPPQVCPTCGHAFRGLYGNEAQCYECRTKAEEAAKTAKERAAIEAEVIERLKETGEF